MRYCPQTSDGKPIPVLLLGDQLTCERLKTSKESRINGIDDWGRLEGLLPSVTDWHLRKLLLQVLIINEKVFQIDIVMPIVKIN